ESGTLYGRSLDGLAAKRILGLRAAARAATAARKSPALRAAKDVATRIAAWLRDGGAHGATCTAELDDDGAAWIVVRARAEALGPLARPKRR
ncbi:MAG: hypothetical protein IT379_05510, partial [Deltaproteobacteria bacterium]|nr:hypothetical protein [Deltaproteobacteria bacterium]